MAVENATLLSPGAVSTWIGYLNAREHWGYEELRERWSAVTSNLDGRLTFIVQLSAFPKTDLLESGEGTAADERSLCLERCLVAFAKPSTRPLDASDHLRTDRTEATVNCTVTPLGRFSSDDWRTLMEPRWLSWIPALAPLWPSRLCKPSPYDFVTGDFHTAFFLVEAPLTREMEEAPEIKLVLLGSKERTAVFAAGSR